MDLLFERFLNENRNEWPDVDLDLPCGDKREQAIQYVYQQYGELGAAMTANVITYRGKSAAREVGKALGFDEETLGRLSGLIGHRECARKTRHSAITSVMRASTSATGASPSTPSYASGGRIFRAISGNISVAWSSVKASSIRLCPSNAPACPVAVLSNGIKKTVRTLASSRLIYSASA
jgi:hypothetical protein